jgi:hypothetical protein
VTSIGTEPAIDEEFVFWTENAFGLVYRVRKEGGARELLASDQTSAGELILRDGDLLWTTRGVLKNYEFQRDGSGKNREERTHLAEHVSFIGCKHCVIGSR